MPLLINLLVLIIIVGFVLYILNLLPIDATMKNIAHAIILLVVLLWLLNLFAGGAVGLGMWPMRCP